MISNASQSPFLAAPARCLDASDQAQRQRFELKYLVSESVARAMRQFVRAYTRPDEFAAQSSDHSYTVHTLYLDSPDLALFGATNNGDTNRFKLRVRFYSEAPGAPAFFEVKRRRNECIAKLRAKVPREVVGPLLRGEWPQLSHLAKPDATQLFALREFFRLQRVLDATPRSHVAYQREAWMGPADNSLRLTFDRQVQCEPQFNSALRAVVDADAAVEPFESRVIFELKFTNRMPHWCGELIRAFGLVRGSAAKYAEGVVRLGEHRLSNQGVGVKLATASERVRDAMLQGHTVNVT